MLIKAFTAETWGQDRGRNFEFGTKYGFFNVAKNAIELGAQFFKIIMQDPEYRLWDDRNTV